MKLVKVCLLTVVVAVGMVMPAWAQQQDHPATPPLVQLLQSKGILSPDEAARLSQASSADEANARLAQMLVAKGLISQDDYNQMAATSAPVSDSGSGGGHLLNALVRIPSRIASTPTPASSDPYTFGAPSEGGVIPAIAPVRVLPIDVPKQGGLIPDIKLGSGVNMKLYGF